MATKFRVECKQGGKWQAAASEPFDKKDEAVEFAEHLSVAMSKQTRVQKVVSKIVWQSKQPLTEKT